MNSTLYTGTTIAAKVAMPTDCYIVKTATFTGKYDKAGRKVWKHNSSKHPYYLVWDELHGEIEVFSVKKLTHRAIYLPNGDRSPNKHPIAGRKLEFR